MCHPLSDCCCCCFNFILLCSLLLGFFVAVCSVCFLWDVFLLVWFLLFFPGQVRMKYLHNFLKILFLWLINSLMTDHSDQLIRQKWLHHQANCGNQTKSGTSNWPGIQRFWVQKAVSPLRIADKRGTGVEEELTTAGPFKVKAADGLRVEEVMVLRPRPDWGLSCRPPGGGLGGREVRGILGRDGVFVFTLQARRGKQPGRRWQKASHATENETNEAKHAVHSVPLTGTPPPVNGLSQLSLL